MDFSHPHRAVSPGLEGEVLVALSHSSLPLTGRQVHGMVGRGSQKGVAEALGRLADHGVVDVTQAGRAYLFTLNREHVATAAVLAMAGMRQVFLQRMKDEIAGWQRPPLHASLFGSAARGDGNNDSDVDLLVVRRDECDEEDPVWRAQLFQLGEHVRRWTGNPMSTAELSEDELAELRQSRRPIVANLEKEGRTLYGTEVRKLFGGDPKWRSKRSESNPAVATRRWSGSTTRKSSSKSRS